MKRIRCEMVAALVQQVGIRTKSNGQISSNKRERRRKHSLEFWTTGHVQCQLSRCVFLETWSHEPSY